MLDRGSAQGARVNPDAIDQYESVVALGATHKYRCRLSGAAIAADVDTGLEAQQLGEVFRERELDVLTRDYGDRHDRVTEWNLGPRGRNDYCLAGRHVGG